MLFCFAVFEQNNFIYFTVYGLTPLTLFHPGELVAKVWGTLGSNRLKCTGYKWAPNLLKSVALAPGVLNCGAASAPHRRAPPQKGLRSTPRAKLLKSAGDGAPTARKPDSQCLQGVRGDYGVTKGSQEIANEAREHVVR